MQFLGRNFLTLFGRGIGLPSSTLGVSRELSTLTPQPTALQNGLFNQLTSYPLLTAIRTHMRIHFPRPKESMRIRKHGWKARMKTKGGRQVIMRRILKGRYSLTH